jgi:hypothetical protein
MPRIVEAQQPRAGVVEPLIAADRIAVVVGRYRLIDNRHTAGTAARKAGKSTPPAISCGTCRRQCPATCGGRLH